MTIDQTFDISLTDPTSEKYRNLYEKIAPVVSILCFIFNEMYVYEKEHVDI